MRVMLCKCSSTAVRTNSTWNEAFAPYAHHLRNIAHSAARFGCTMCLHHPSLAVVCKGVLAVDGPLSGCLLQAMCKQQLVCPALSDSCCERLQPGKSSATTCIIASTSVMMSDDNRSTALTAACMQSGITSSVPDNVAGLQVQRIDGL